MLWAAKIVGKMWTAQKVCILPCSPQLRVPSVTMTVPTSCSCRFDLLMSQVRVCPLPHLVTTFYKCTRTECGYQWREN